MSELGSILRLEYGAALSAENRTGWGYPVFGSNGEVGRHAKYLIGDPGIVVGRKGSVGQVSWSDEPFWPIDTAYWVDCRPDDRRWLFWLLSYLPLKRLDTSTGVPGLNRNDVYELSVFRPDAASRDKIAEVLDTLDAAIRGAEAVVAKLRAMKQGLLHDLLTRGIDANGDLRPPQPDSPHLYHQTPLGWLPKEWDVMRLGDAADSVVDGPFGSNLKTEHYVSPPGVRVVRLQNIQDGYFDDTEKAFIRESHAARLIRNQVVSGDLLIASLGDDGHPVGRACLYPEELDAGINKADCFRFRGRAICRNGYTMLFLNGHSARRQARGFEQGVTMKRINLGNLRRIKVALPPIPEQIAIEERATAIEASYSATLRELDKLRLQKSGLMDDLLTGRVPVTPLL